MGQLLKWSPTIVTTLQTAEIFNIRGIQVDCIITEGHEEVVQSNIMFIPAGNHSISQAALTHLITQAYPAVNIITDELNYADYECFVDKINMVIYNNHKKIYPISSGFSKWKPVGDFFELLTPANNLNFKGLTNTQRNKYITI